VLGVVTAQFNASLTGPSVGTECIALAGCSGWMAFDIEQYTTEATIVCAKPRQLSNSAAR